jgi:hypothetical protein
VETRKTGTHRNAEKYIEIHRNRNTWWFPTSTLVFDLYILRYHEWNPRP